MPRTPDGVVDEQSLAERSRVMRARRADREHLSTLPHEKNRLAVRMADDHLAVFEVGERNAVRQIRAGELLFSAHE
jgi:hypothetical protein